MGGVAGIPARSIETRVLTTGHSGCTFTVHQKWTGAIPEADGGANADGSGAQAHDLSAFCCARNISIWRTSHAATACSSDGFMPSSAAPPCLEPANKPRLPHDDEVSRKARDTTEKRYEPRGPSLLHAVAARMRPQLPGDTCPSATQPISIAASTGRPLQRGHKPSPVSDWPSCAGGNAAWLRSHPSRFGMGQEREPQRASPSGQCPTPLRAGGTPLAGPKRRLPLPYSGVPMVCPLERVEGPRIGRQQVHGEVPRLRSGRHDMDMLL